MQKLFVMIILLVLTVVIIGVQTPVFAESSYNLNGLPVLMYHFFYDKSKGERGKDNNWIEISKFKSHMKYLHDNNYYFPTWAEVQAYVKGKKKLPPKSIVVTIDDAQENFFRLAVPVLKKYNIKATSFIITKNMTAKKATYKSSLLEFQSHSHNMHIRSLNGTSVFITMSRSAALKDLIKSKDILGSSDAFAYPFGYYNTATMNLLKTAGFKLGFTTEYGKVRPGMNTLKLPRIRMQAYDNLNEFINKIK